MYRHRYTTGALLVLAVALIIGSWTAHKGQSRFTEALTKEISSQREVMGNLARITDRNGADETIGAIVTDCARRDEFDALLITLGTLSKQNLLLAQSMFESCGEFYPVQKALMVVRLEQEYDEYMKLWALQESLVESERDMEDDRGLWGEVVTLEKTRSDLITEQWKLQEQIINALIQGSSVSSADVRSLVSEAQEVGELISVYDKQIDELRTKLHIS